MKIKISLVLIFIFSCFCSDENIELVQNAKIDFRVNKIFAKTNITNHNLAKREVINIY